MTLYLPKIEEKPCKSCEAHYMREDHSGDEQNKRPYPVTVRCGVVKISYHVSNLSHSFIHTFIPVFQSKSKGRSRQLQLQQQGVVQDDFDCGNKGSFKTTLTAAAAATAATAENCDCGCGNYIQVVKTQIKKSLLEWG